MSIETGAGKSEVISTDTIRSVEIEAIRGEFRAGMTVLEIGAGRGVQASTLRSFGCRVLALEVDFPAGPLLHPVVLYDGLNIPAPKGVFDVVYSSNVLEHIPDPRAFMRSLLAFMTGNAVAIHAIPTATWRWWSLLTHYVYVVNYALGRRRGTSQVAAGTAPVQRSRRGLTYLIRRALIAPAHGEYPSAAAELYFYRAGRWRRLFRRAGYRVERELPAGLFYTDYLTFPRFTVDFRRRLARFLGASTRIFIMRAAEVDRA